MGIVPVSIIINILFPSRQSLHKWSFIRCNKVSLFKKKTYYWKMLVNVWQNMTRHLLYTNLCSLQGAGKSVLADGNLLPKQCVLVYFINLVSHHYLFIWILLTWSLYFTYGKISFFCFLFPDMKKAFGTSLQRLRSQ